MVADRTRSADGDLGAEARATRAQGRSTRQTHPPSDQPWVDWLIEAAWDYKATVQIIPGYKGEAQAFLIPRRLN